MFQLPASRPLPTLVHVLELRRENLETVEVQIASSSPCVGRQTSTDKAEVAVGSTELRAGDQLLAGLEPGQRRSCAGPFSHPSDRQRVTRRARVRRRGTMWSYSCVTLTSSNCSWPPAVDVLLDLADTGDVALLLDLRLHRAPLLGDEHA